MKQHTFWNKSILHLHGCHDAYSMAECYKNGRYVKKDLDTAIFLYKKAILEGNKNAYLALGELYEEESKSSTQEQGQKLELHRQALKTYFDGALHANLSAKVKLQQLATARDAIACFYMGAIWEHERNIENAIDWYKKAAMAGGKVLTYAMNALVQMSASSSRAALCLAQMYEKHEWGILKNVERMMEFYEKAGEMGDKDAEFRLGQLYQIDHDGIKKDMNKVWNFYVQSAKHGNQEAIVPLERLGEDMDAKQQQQLSDVYKLSFFNNPMKASYWNDKAQETECLQLVAK